MWKHIFICNKLINFLENECCRQACYIYTVRYRSRAEISLQNFKAFYTLENIIISKRKTQLCPANLKQNKRQTNRHFLLQFRLKNKYYMNTLTTHKANSTKTYTTDYTRVCVCVCGAFYLQQIVLEFDLICLRRRVITLSVIQLCLSVCVSVCYSWLQKYVNIRRERETASWLLKDFLEVMFNCSSKQFCIWSLFIAYL